MGSRAVNHAINSVVRRIRVEPVELRRHSINRASGHTFEYVGFGPGNYSTALPDKHDRSISAQEEILAQSTRKDGGINFYTGMNDKGIAYVGNTKLSSTTGQEEIFETPVQTITGEDIGNLPGLNIISPVEGNFSRSIRVEGGSDSKAISEFNGPVIFSGKVTSNSSSGLEAISLFLQGDATVSRKYTVGTTEPTLAGNTGDIVYLDNPEEGGYIGWVYTTDNDWYRFGNISISLTSNVYIFDQVGIATTSPGNSKLLVGSGTTQVSIDGNGGVGIGTTANGYKLHVIGSTNIVGTVTATSFVGDGSGLTGIGSQPWTAISEGLYNTSLTNVGIGTSVPGFNLEVGSPGAGGTSLRVNNGARFDYLDANNVNITGIITASSYRFNGGTGSINAGIVTTGTLVVGSGGIALTNVGPNVGIGTLSPREKLDVEGTLRTKIVREAVHTLSISANIVTVDLSIAQNFLLSATAPVNEFRIINPPSEVSSFTIIITQDATGGKTIDIDDFKTSSGSLIPVFWPGGGVIPSITPTANRSDIYTFKTFDGGANWYGVIVGQNFLN